MAQDKLNDTSMVDETDSEGGSPDWTKNTASFGQGTKSRDITMNVEDDKNNAADGKNNAEDAKDNTEDDTDNCDVNDDGDDNEESESIDALEFAKEKVAAAEKAFKGIKEEKDEKLKKQFDGQVNELGLADAIKIFTATKNGDKSIDGADLVAASRIMLDELTWHIGIVETAKLERDRVQKSRERAKQHYQREIAELTKQLHGAESKLKKVEAKHGKLQIENEKLSKQISGVMKAEDIKIMDNFRRDIRELHDKNAAQQKEITDLKGKYAEAEDGRKALEEQLRILRRSRSPHKADNYNHGRDNYNYRRDNYRRGNYKPDNYKPDKYKDDNKSRHYNQPKAGYNRESGNNGRFGSNRKFGNNRKGDYNHKGGYNDRSKF